MSDMTKGFQSIILNSIFQILSLGFDCNSCNLRLARFREAVDQLEEQEVSRNAANKKFLNLIEKKKKKDIRSPKGERRSFALA